MNPHVTVALEEPQSAVVTIGEVEYVFDNPEEVLGVSELLKRTALHMDALRQGVDFVAVAESFCDADPVERLIRSAQEEL